MNRPDATSNTNASAISATTSTARTRRNDEPDDVRGPASFSALITVGLVACAAGAMPKSTPVTTATIAANSNTARSMLMSTAGGSVYGGIND